MPDCSRHPHGRAANPQTARPPHGAPKRQLRPLREDARASVAAQRHPKPPQAEAKPPQAEARHRKGDKGVTVAGCRRRDETQSQPALEKDDDVPPRGPPDEFASTERCTHGKRIPEGDQARSPPAAKIANDRRMHYDMNRPSPIRSGAGPMPGRGPQSLIPGISLFWPVPPGPLQ